MSAISREAILVKNEPTRGVIIINNDEKIPKMDINVNAAAIALGIWNFLILTLIISSIRGFPMSDMTAEIIMYMTISLKHHAMKPMTSAPATPNIYFISLFITAILYSQK